MVTQAFTSSMEEMIKRRVKEGNFSDVLPPKETKVTMGDEGTGEQDLSQEKNKQGLGEVRPFVLHQHSQRSQMMSNLYVYFVVVRSMLRSSWLRV